MGTLKRLWWNCPGCDFSHGTCTFVKVSARVHPENPVSSVTHSTFVLCPFQKIWKHLVVVLKTTLLWYGDCCHLSRIFTCCVYVVNGSVCFLYIYHVNPIALFTFIGQPFHVYEEPPWRCNWITINYIG